MAVVEKPVITTLAHARSSESGLRLMTPLPSCGAYWANICNRIEEFSEGCGRILISEDSKRATLAASKIVLSVWIWQVGSNPRFCSAKTAGAGKEDSPFSRFGGGSANLFDLFDKNRLPRASDRMKSRWQQVIFGEKVFFGLAKAIDVSCDGACV